MDQQEPADEVEDVKDYRYGHVDPESDIESILLAHVEDLGHA